MRHFILGFSRFKTFLFSFSFLSFFLFFFVLPTNCSWRNRKKVGSDIAGRQCFLKTLTHYNLFVVIRCIQPVYILSDILINNSRDGNCFYELSLLGGMKQVKR